MSDVQALQASIGADVAQFLTAMQQSSAAIQALVQGQNQATQAAQTQSKAHEQSAVSIGLAVEAWHIAAEAARELAGGMVRLGEAAISAATQLDPSAALAWDAASDKMSDGIGAVEARIGSALLPAIESAEVAIGTVAQKIANMDWASFGKGIHNIADSFKGDFESMKLIVSNVVNAIDYQLNELGTSFKDLGATILDALFSPITSAVSGVMTAIAAMELALGKALQTLEQSSAGKGLLGKLGMTGVGDSLVQSATAWTIASATIGAGITTAAKAIAGAVNDLSKGELGKAAGSYATASPNGPSRQADDLAAQRQSMAARLAFENQIAQMKDQENQMEVSAQRTIARERKAALMAEGQQADQAFQQALQQLQQDRSSKNLGALASDQKALADAAAASQRAYTAAVQESKHALDVAIDTAADLNGAYDKQVQVAKKAMEAANKAHEAAVSGGNSEGLKDAETSAQAAYQREQQHMQSLNSQKIAAEQEIIQLQTMSDTESNAAKIRTAHEVAQIQNEADKARAAFYSSTRDTLIQQGMGSVGGGAYAAGQAGFAAAGPLGAAAGVGASLLQNSAGFKAMSDALNSIFQSIADTVGSVLGPIVPVIKQLGAALKPLFDAVTSILTPIGQMVSEVLQPLAVVIHMILAPMTAVMDVIGSLLAVLAPIIEPIATLAALFLVITTLLDPLTIVLILLAPLLKKVADTIQSFVAAIDNVWNGIVQAIQNLIVSVANVLPDDLGGNALRDFASSLDGLKMGVNDVTVAVQGMAAAVDSYTQTTTSDNQQYDAAVQKRNALDAALAAAKANPNESASDLAAIQAADDKAHQEFQQIFDQAAIDIAKADVAAHKPGADAELQAAYAQQAIDIANTSATAANTKATQDLIATLTNTPQGFRIAAYEYGATGNGAPAGASGGSTAGWQGNKDKHSHGGNIVISGDVHVTANDPDAFMKALRTHVANNRNGIGGF